MAIYQHLPSEPSKWDDLTDASLEALSGIDVTDSVCSPYRVRTCAWLNAETSHVKCFNPQGVQTVPDSIGNRGASRRACSQEFLQLAGVKNVKALDLARPSHHHHLRLPLSINIGEIAGRLIGIVREIGQPESFGSCVVSKENGVDNDRCSDQSRKVAATLPLRHSCHQLAASLHHRLSKPALAQACAVSSLVSGMMSEIGIFQQPRLWLAVAKHPFIISGR
jgi:hypothetical protein